MYEQRGRPGRALRALMFPVAALALVAALSLSGTTSSAASTTWTATDPLPTQRASATATELPNGKVLFAGGISSKSVPQHSAYLYDPVKQKWAATAPMLTARAFDIAVLLQNGMVLVAGGYTKDSSGFGYTATAEVFNPSTTTWSAVPSMSTPRAEFAATLLADGRVLVAGGVNSAANISGINLDSAEIYDPGANSWTPTPTMPTQRSDFTASRLANGNVLLVGGYRGYTFDPEPGAPSDPLAQAVVYNVTSGQWQATGDVFIQRFFQTATALNDGTVLVVGGYPSNVVPGTTPPSPDAEIYQPDVIDPDTGAMGTWAPVAPMPSGRAQHSATLLADGRVLVAGGLATDGSLITSAVVFNPGSGSWSDGGTMNTGRRAFAATLLSSAPCGNVCNEVLVAGGGAGGNFLTGAGTAAAELFTPPPPSAGSLGSAGNGTGSETSGDEVPVPDTGLGAAGTGILLVAIGVSGVILGRPRDPNPSSRRRSSTPV